MSESFKVLWEYDGDIDQPPARIVLVGPGRRDAYVDYQEFRVSNPWISTESVWCEAKWPEEMADRAIEDLAARVEYLENAYKEDK